jgi:alkylhydroperoxidase family enzyme
MEATGGPRIPPLPAEEWSEEIRSLLSATGRGDGQPLNIFTTLARHPELFQTWLPFGGYLLLSGSLSLRDRELAILRTAYNCRSPYEWGQHVRISLDAGIDRDTIDRVVRGPEADGWDEREVALLTAADELHTEAAISDSTWAALARHYDERQLIELPVLVGQYHLVAFALNSLGVQPEPGLEPLP